MQLLFNFQKYSYLTETTETAITKLRIIAPNTVPTIIRMSSLSGKKKTTQKKQETAIKNSR